MAAKPPTYIEIPATCHKAQISEYLNFAGHRNAFEYAGHAPGTLEFDTFAGALDKPLGVYIGALRFLSVTPNAAAPHTDFHNLLREHGNEGE